MVDFAGWSMPVQYTSIVKEHTTTRSAAALFDISHMGRFRFDGDDAAALLDRLVTRRILGLGRGKIRYGLVTNEAGGILDDVLVYHLADELDQPFHLLVVNAGNRMKILQWLEPLLHDVKDVVFHDRTLDTSMIAVQGPNALAVAQPIVANTLEEMAYYTGVVTSIGETVGIVSRTGYTGEDGCELIVPAVDSQRIWEQLLKQGEQHGARPAGLGARDTLRLEAAMPLYGHELTEDINPYQAGLNFAVQLKDRDFIGRDALEKLKADTSQQVRVGLELNGRRIPREGYSILVEDDKVGTVTSGTFSPTLQRPIAMGYVDSAMAANDTQLTIDIRGRREPACVVKLPFYTRST